MRGNEVVIFSRVLLFAPQVARSTVQPNDLIATMYLRKFPVSDPKEVISKWFGEEIQENKNEFKGKSAKHELFRPRAMSP